MKERRWQAELDKGCNALIAIVCSQAHFFFAIQSGSYIFCNIYVLRLLHHPDG